jgi:hypothetical protein
MSFGLSFIDSEGCRYFRPYPDYISAYDAAENASSAGMRNIIIYDYDSETNTYIEFIQF